jgi:site-specific DNA recombinase
MTRLAMTHAGHKPNGVCPHNRCFALAVIDTEHARAMMYLMSKRTRSGSSLVAVAYIRASKDEQKLGPEAQRASIEAWAAREGVSVASWHVDQGVCSVTPIEGRPALLGALVALREHGAGFLVVAKRDRIARDVVLSALVSRAVVGCGAAVVSAAGEGNGDAPADAFMRTVIDGAAEYERGLIRARTKAALAAKSAKGERVGSVPYGFRLDVDGVRLVADEAEQAVLSQVRELAASGFSQRSIVSELAVRGYLSRSGRPFQKTQVVRMLVA